MRGIVFIAVVIDVVGLALFPERYAAFFADLLRLNADVIAGRLQLSARPRSLPISRSARLTS
jgi:hypothetical protein